MRKAADLLKKLIVQVDTGNIVGKVEDLLLDPEREHLVALITMTGRWMREAALIPWEYVIVCTGDVILVQPGTEPQAASAIAHLQHLLERNIHVTGTKVLTSSGDKVGTVGEMLIDADGKIAGFAVKRGFLRAERQFVSAEDVEAIGSDALIVHDNLPRSSPAESAEPVEALTSSIIMPFTGTRITTSLASHHETAEPSADLPPADPLVAYTGTTISVERAADPPPAEDAPSAPVTLLEPDEPDELVSPEIAPEIVSLEPADEALPPDPDLSHPGTLLDLAADPSPQQAGDQPPPIVQQDSAQDREPHLE